MRKKIFVALVFTFEAISVLGQTSPYPQNYVLSFPRTSILSAPVSSQHDLGTAFTLETWIYRSEPAPLTGANMIIGKQSNTEKPYFLEYDGIGKIRFWVMNKVVTVPTQLVTRRWTHIAGTLSGGSIRLYVDGQLIGTTNNVPTPTGSTLPIQVGGAVMPSGFWCCTVEDTYLRQARIWNRALSQTEIQTNMGLRMNGNEAGLRGQWMMDEGQGQTVFDSSAIHLDLQIGNASAWDVYDANWVRTRVVDQLLYFQWETYPAAANMGSIQGGLIDIDTDGDLDWFDFRSVFPSGTDLAHVYRNNGAGVFTDVTSAVLPQSVQTNATNFEYKDFNGDGRTDIFFNDTGPDAPPFPGGPVRILIQQASGTFVDETSTRLPAMTRLSMVTASADIDGDGDIDILLTSRRPPGPELLINDGSGHFTINQSRLPAWVTSIQRPMMSGVFLNVNGDNFPDLYFGEQNGVTTRDAILINNGAGVFVDTPTTTLPLRLYGTTGYILAARAGDFNNDGRSDILASVATPGNTLPNRFQIYLSNGDGTYRDGSSGLPTVGEAAAEDEIYYPYIADFNRDGKMDFITSAFTRVVQIYLNTGGGRFVLATDIYPANRHVQFPVPGDIDNDGDIDIVSAMNAQFAVLRNQNPLRVGSPTFDMDGDGKTDLGIFRPNGVASEWWWLKSSTGGNAALQFGSSTDRLVPSDYTGDGKTDVAFWRPSTGQWFVLRSEDFSFYAFPFGANGDVPVPADYDGDGKSDAAVFRESAVTWFINKSSGGTDIVGFGAAGDKPVNADYDGDGKSDIAIFRPSGVNGAEWWVRRSSNASVFALQFGNSTDKAVPGDFTGDGKADVAFWRPATGFWNVLRSEDFSYYAFPFGANGDTPVPGDYDGDGKTDAGVFRQPGAQWFVNKSTGGTLIQQFGITGDVPLPNAFVR